MIAGRLAQRAQRLAEQRTPFAIATVVRAQRPTSVRAGDSALVLADGTIEGFVGGLCAESSVRLHALRAMETGEPLLLRIIPDDPAAAEPGEGAVVEHNPCLSGGALEIFLEPRLPPGRVVIVGDSPVSAALTQLASAAGYDAQHGVDEIAGNVAAVIVAAHGAGEERALAAALLAGVPYVALVASPIRGEAVRASLEVPEQLRDRLHTPAGLDIGARSPAEIAISILAELVAEHHADPGAAQGAVASVRSSGAEGAVVSVRDPVCGMRVAPSEATPQLDVDGERVFFCGERCRSAYAEQHPAAAVPRTRVR